MNQVLGSQKSKLTPLELVFQTTGAINHPPPYKDMVKGSNLYFVAMIYIKKSEPSLSMENKNAIVKTKKRENLLNFDFLFEYQKEIALL